MTDHYSPFQKIILAHARRYPLWQVQDFYKLAHQAALGSEHAVINPVHARLWLEEEVRSFRGGITEPIIDPISADGSIVRVHLEPYIGAGYSTDELLHAFLQTSTDFKGSKDVLHDYLAQAEELSMNMDISINPAVFREFTVAMQAAGFPAVHHSSVYREHYSPAYRVVAREFLSPSLISQ